MRRKGEVFALEVEVGSGFLEGVELGASVAVNGCCLTVVSRGETTLAFEAIPETLERTALGSKEVGARLNLERALPASGRLDGHIVQGHVDGCGSVVRYERTGDDVRLGVACDAQVAGYLVPKGSVTIDGVSLTVVGVLPDGFDVALIPHTLAVTTLGELALGDRVNLEVDIIGKYVHHFLQRRGEMNIS